MSVRLGWSSAGTALPPDCVAQPIGKGRLVEIRGGDGLGQGKARLLALQTCYRTCAGFLPAPAAGQEFSAARIEAVFDDLAEWGQLTLRLERVAALQVSADSQSNGRAFLHGRVRALARRTDAGRLLSRIVATIAAPADASWRQARWNADGHVVNLLLHKSEEGALRERVAAAIPPADASGRDGARLAVSGLWAPVTFAAERLQTYG